VVSFFQGVVQQAGGERKTGQRASVTLLRKYIENAKYQLGWEIEKWECGDYSSVDWYNVSRAAVTQEWCRLGRDNCPGLVHSTPCILLKSSVLSCIVSE
jgi:hypothetical protein